MAEPLAPTRKWLATAPPRKSEGDRTAAKRQRILILAAVFLTLCGVFLGLITWLRPTPKPYFVPLVITEYAPRDLPFNPQATADRQALIEGRYFARTNVQAFGVQERTLLERELDLLKERPAQDLVVYLGALATTGPGGEVYILPADAQIDKFDTMIPLGRVLRSMKASRANRKLLILDIAKPLADVHLGVLLDDVPAAVKRALEAHADPNLLVLCAASPGQVALESDDVGRSIFSFYFEEGLRGWADGYNATGKRDGRVSVRELAAFTEARVDRWAWRNRGQRQTPLLLGKGHDFDLLALAHDRPQPPLPPPPETTYPIWLQDAWKLRDAWWAAEYYRDAPAPALRLQAATLRAEQDWRDGRDPGRIASDLADRIQDDQARLTQARALRQPLPHSLAVAAAQGWKPDPAVAPALAELLTKADAQFLTAKPGEADKVFAQLAPPFVEKFKTKTDFDLASAIFDAAVADAAASPQRLRFLQTLMQAFQPQPSFHETYWLARLADLAGRLEAPAWPRESVRRALQVVLKGERAASRPATLLWVRDLLEEAANNRHRGLALLFATGYGPTGEADALLRRASDQYEVVLALQDTIVRGQQCRDEAYAFLPEYVPYLEFVPHAEKPWIEAIQTTIGLADTLALRASPLSAAALHQRVEDVRQRTLTLRDQLDSLREPFTSTRRQQLEQISGQPEAGAQAYEEIQAALYTPFLSVADRVALDKAGRALGRRLHEATRQLDLSEDRARKITDFEFDFKPEEPRWERRQREFAGRRARASVALLRLGGLARNDLDQLDEALHKAGEPGADATSGSVALQAAAIPALEDALRQKWYSQFPAQMRRETDLQAQNRASWVLAYFQISILFRDGIDWLPRRDLRAEQWRNLYAWLANRYRFDRSDLRDREPAIGRMGLTFYANAIRDYQPGDVPAEIAVRITGGDDLPNFRVVAAGATTLQIELDAPAKSKPAVTLQILTADDDWLRISADTSQLAQLQTPSPAGTRRAKVPLYVALKPGAQDSGTPAPRGFLILLQVDGRTYHYPIAVPTLPGFPDVRAYLVADLQKPGPLPADLRLRPLPAPQLYYLIVVNPTDKPRKLAVELSVNGVALPGGSAKLELGPNETKPVLFPPPSSTPPPAPPMGQPSKPMTDLPELSGPLQIQVLDADNKTVLDVRRITVDIAAPWEYVQIAEMQFAPSRGEIQNRLTAQVQALPAFTGPPATVEMVLPPNRIPGFLGLQRGTLRGTLSAPNDAVQLFAQGLQLAPGAEETGYVYFTVDGVARAFRYRTTFARSGDPTSPQADDQPDIRFQAERYALAGPKFALDIAVDSPPPGASLEVTVSRVVDGRPVAERTAKRTTARQRRVGFQLQGAEGILLFQASIQDWNVGLDAAGILGPREVRARLLDREGQEIRSFTQTVTFDDSAPERIKFFDTPTQGVKGTALTVKATGNDVESGVSQVFFFLGKPVDGKPPPGATPMPGVALDDTKTVWSAKLPLPADRKGPTDVSVQFVNGVGLSSFATMSIEVVDSDPSKTGPGRIVGKVVEGPRPQGNLEVVLRDDKGAEKGKTKTRDDGSFEFENVAPGSYKVQSSKPQTDRKTEKPVTVAPNQTSSVTLELLL